MSRRFLITKTLPGYRQHCDNRLDRYAGCRGSGAAGLLQGSSAQGGGRVSRQPISAGCIALAIPGIMPFEKPERCLWFARMFKPCC